MRVGDSVGKLQPNEERHIGWSGWACRWLYLVCSGLLWSRSSPVARRAFGPWVALSVGWGHWEVGFFNPHLVLEQNGRPKRTNELGFLVRIGSIPQGPGAHVGALAGGVSCLKRALDRPGSCEAYRYVSTSRERAVSIVQRYGMASS